MPIHKPARTLSYLEFISAYSPTHRLYPNPKKQKNSSLTESTFSFSPTICLKLLSLVLVHSQNWDSLAETKYLLIAVNSGLFVMLIPLNLRAAWDINYWPNLTDLSPIGFQLHLSPCSSHIILVGLTSSIVLAFSKLLSLPPPRVWMSISTHYSSMHISVT